MEPSRRSILLEALDRWQARGLLDADAHARLRQDVEAEPETAPTTAARRSIAVETLHLVGGLLLGAGLVALVVYLELEQLASATLLVLMGAVAVGAGVLFDREGEAGARRGLADAAYATGLVAMGVGSVFDGPGDGLFQVVALAAALFAAVPVVVRKGATPIVALATAAFVAASVGVFVELFENDGPGPYLWWLSLAAWLGMLLVWRSQTWAGVSAGLQALPMAVAFILILLRLDLDSSVLVETLVGVHFAALMAVGVVLHVRGLVAGAAAGLVVDAVVFAFDVGGPGTAVVVLLALGGVTVWQAEFLRGYFGRRGKREGI